MYLLQLIYPKMLLFIISPILDQQQSAFISNVENMLNVLYSGAWPHGLQYSHSLFLSRCWIIFSSTCLFSGLGSSVTAVETFSRLFSGIHVPWGIAKEIQPASAKMFFLIIGRKFGKMTWQPQMHRLVCNGTDRDGGISIVHCTVVSLWLTSVVFPVISSLLQELRYRSLLKAI